MWNTSRKGGRVAGAIWAPALPVFFILVLCSCKPLFTFAYLDISCSLGEKQEYCADEKIQIRFSFMPNVNEVESKIRFYEDGSNVLLDFEWHNSTVLIRPHLPWQKGQSYALDLQGAIKMEDGRAYTARLYRTFIYGEQGNEFELASNELSQDKLTFNFSKPVSINSFLDKFSLSPFADCHTDFSNNGSTVTISPKNNWTSNTAYTWTIKNIVSADGYLMKKEYSGTLSGIYDIEQPVLTLACPVDYDSQGSLWYASYSLDNQLLENQAIGFSFSKPMDEASVSAGISFFPSISGYFIKETESRFIFIPDNQYQISKEYRITIAETIKDSSGLALYEPAYLFFTTANQFLRIAKITFDDNTNPMPVDGTIVDYSMLPPLNPANPVILKTVINFSTAIPLDKHYDAVNVVSLNVLFPTSANNPSPISAYWSDGGARLAVEWAGFSISTSSDIKNYYMLKVGGGQGGFKNQANEYMEADVCVTFIAY
jgi:hypothetical protein